jgi:predicted transcriptional regulator
MAKPMRTVSFKLPPELDEELERLARQRGASKSVLAREALEALAREKRRSVTALAGRVVGSLEGPRDLSVNPKHWAGYGD